MGWICPDCSSENSFLHNRCEACGKTVGTAFLITEKKADRREHQATRNAATTAGFLKRRKQLQMASVFLYGAIAVIVGLFMIQCVAAGVVTSSGDQADKQQILLRQYDKFDNSAKNRIALIRDGMLPDIRSNMNNTAASIYTVFSYNIRHNLASAGNMLQSRDAIYPNDKILTEQNRKYSERVSQRMEWLYVQTAHVIQTIRSFDPIKFFLGN